MSVKSLLTDLADSIRLKSGKTGKMSLEEMAAALMGVTVEDDVGFTIGTFTASTTGSAKTVNHGLGQEPGAVIFIKMGSYDTSSSSSTTFYDALFCVVYGKESGYNYCYHYYRKAVSSSSSSTSNRTWSYSSTTADAMFGSGKSTNSYYITNINETSFTTPTKLVKGKNYLWIAFRAPLR